MKFAALFFRNRDNGVKKTKVKDYDGNNISRRRFDIGKLLTRMRTGIVERLNIYLKKNFIYLNKAGLGKASPACEICIYDADTSLRKNGAVPHFFFPHLHRGSRCGIISSRQRRKN